MWVDQLLSTTISEEQLQDAHALARKKGIPLDEALVEWGYATWDEIAPLRAADNGVPFYADDAQQSKATTPNCCPLCASAIDPSRIKVIGHWDGEPGNFGPVLECRCPRCFGRLTTAGSQNWDFSAEYWEFEPTRR